MSKLLNQEAATLRGYAAPQYILPKRSAESASNNRSTIKSVSGGDAPPLSCETFPARHQPGSHVYPPNRGGHPDKIQSMHCHDTRVTMQKLIQSECRDLRIRAFSTYGATIDRLMHGVAHQEALVRTGSQW